MEILSSQYRLSSNLCGQIKKIMKKLGLSLNTASAVTFVVTHKIKNIMKKLSQYRLSSNLCGHMGKQCPYCGRVSIPPQQ